MHGDDYDDNPKCTIIGEYDLNTVGNYNLTMKVEDFSGNITKKDFILKVVKPVLEQIKKVVDIFHLSVYHS